MSHSNINISCSIVCKTKYCTTNFLLSFINLSIKDLNCYLELFKILIYIFNSVTDLIEPAERYVGRDLLGLWQVVMCVCL